VERGLPDELVIKAAKALYGKRWADYQFNGRTLREWSEQPSLDLYRNLIFLLRERAISFDIIAIEISEMRMSLSEQPNAVMPTIEI
jgi:hypothetical protein